MTPDERKQISERIQQADQIDSRIRRLKDALHNLTCGECVGIAISFDSVIPDLKWRAKDEKDFKPVCWGTQETGLRDELKELVVALIAKRLQEAEESYAQI